MSKKEETGLGDKAAIDQQIEDIQANITLLSGWQQAHKNGEMFIFGIPGQNFAMQVKQDDGKAYEIMSEMLDAVLEKEGKQLIQLRTAKANMN